MGIFLRPLHSGAAILFIPKSRLNNRTVMRLPFIEPAFGVSMRPAVTPLGVVYATRNGIFLWNGGDTTQKLSTQIDGFFHRSNDNWNFYAAKPGRLDYWHPFVAVPNNYLYDTRTNSWWRLEDPTVHGLGVPYSHYNKLASTGWLYAFPLRVVDVDSTVAGDTFDWNTLASSYSWQSQPLVETRDRTRSFQEVTIVVSPGNDAVADKKVYVNLKGIGQDGVPVSVTTFSRLSIPPDSLIHEIHSFLSAPLINAVTQDRTLSTQHN